MRTFLAENWTMGITTKSGMVWANWYSDYWICQTNVGYHPQALWGKWKPYWSWEYFAEWFYDPYKQMDHCIELFKWGTVFYAFKHRYARTKQIIIL